MFGHARLAPAKHRRATANSVVDFAKGGGTCDGTQATLASLYRSEWNHDTYPQRTRMSADHKKDRRNLRTKSTRLFLREAIQIRRKTIGPHRNRSHTGND